MGKTQYDADSITVLEGLEAVRKRPGMYIGSVGTKGLNHLIYEIVDNSVDEHLAGACSQIRVTLEADGSCTVRDNGRGIPVEMHKKGMAAAAAVLSVIVSVVMTVISMAFMKPLLILMNTPEDIFQDAYKYIMIICAGIFTQVMYNLLAGILRALGNSKTPLYFLLFSAGLNIVLDLVLIIVFHLGAAGAAYATVIAQGVSALLCLIYIIKKVPILKLDRWDFKLDGHLVRQQLAIGFPMALQYSITAIGAMMVQAALNVLGSVHVAAFTAANKIEQVVTQVYVALGTTMATYCAQNMGAGKVKRISRGFRATTVMGSVYSVVFGVLVFYFGNMLTGLFVSENLDQIVGLVDIYMKCVALFFIPLNVVNVYRNGIQGMGYGFLPMTAGIAELAGRGLTAVVASHYKSYLGICLASPVAWIFASALLLVMYFGIMNKYKKAGNFRE